MNQPKSYIYVVFSAAGGNAVKKNRTSMLKNLGANPPFSWMTRVGHIAEVTAKVALTLARPL